ncbi:unnamed protein product, partial [Nesidiocoris tenuis]
MISRQFFSHGAAQRHHKKTSKSIPQTQRIQPLQDERDSVHRGVDVERHLRAEVHRSQRTRLAENNELADDFFVRDDLAMTPDRRLQYQIEEERQFNLVPGLREQPRPTCPGIGPRSQTSVGQQIQNAFVRNLLRSRLRECGWVDEVHMMCRQTRRNSDMTLNDLYAEVAKKSR